jgi:hypothetical protein
LLSGTERNKRTPAAEAAFLLDAVGTSELVPFPKTLDQLLASRWEKHQSEEHDWKQHDWERHKREGLEWEGHDFSCADKSAREVASATEVCFMRPNRNVTSAPQRLKPLFSSMLLARVNSCPSRNHWINV